ncbi:MAG TPA: NADP-dependent oxidoreductase, partial [Puia sp.]|nr:NADP-dependent oxidoreductase [Puia sp.]
MKAIRLHERGGADKLIWEEAPMPVLRPGDALVKVLASGLTRNELNWGPTYTDEHGNSRLPTIPGHELCGIVTAVALGVAEVTVGEEVYGLTSFFRDGTAAEYVAVRAADLARKPQTLNPYEAAAVPLAGLTAWQALFDHAGLAAGQRILIHGAAGGVGSLAIQLAKWKGAEVIAATAADNLSLVLDLGANQAVDYWAGPFEKQMEPVNVILDTIGGDIQRNSWSILKPGGILVTIAGEGISVPADVKDRKGIFFIVKPDTQEL